MKKPLRALLVEDFEDDALLVVRQLRDGGYDVKWERVETAEAMRAALDRQPWDIVICDYKMPHFNGLAALKLLQAGGLDLPFIIVSGTIGEELAVEAMKAGANDYLMKGGLARLVPAVERELREAVGRRERRLVGDALVASEARYRRLFESAKDGILILNAETGTVVDANPFMLQLLGRARDQLLGKKIWELGSFRDIIADKAGLAELQQQIYAYCGDKTLEGADGRRIDVEFISNTYQVNRHQVMQCNIRDISGRKAVEAALHVKNAALEAAANAVVITDRNGRIEWANPAFTALTGYALAAAIGRDHRELVKSGQQDPEFYRHLWETILAGRVWRGMVTNRRKDGSLYTEEMTITPVRNEQGDIAHFAAIKQDITARQAAAEALQKSEERFRNLAENTSDWIWEINETGVYVYASPRVHDLLGYTPEEVLGRSPLAFMPPPEAARLEPVFAGLVTRHEPCVGLENVCLHKDGRRVVLETSAVPIFDAAGVWRGYRGIDRDITERKQVEAALRQEQALVNGLFDVIPDHIYLKDRQSRYLRINEAMARHLGLSQASEAAGKTDADFLSKEQARQAFAAEQKIMSTGEPVLALEEKEAWPDGRVTWVSITRVPFRDAEGRITGLVGISHDITERKNLQAQYLQSQKMEAFGQLAGGVAHDFNNILGVMLMQFNLMQREPDAPPRTLAACRDLEQLAMRATSLTRQLLLFSRRQNMEPRMLDLNAVLDGVCKMLRRLLGEDIAFELKEATQPLWIEADAGMIEQVVMNLCVNARDAMPQGGRLSIETRLEDRNAAGVHPGRFVCLLVTDTGSGMDQATQERIFEPFFTTKPVGKGTGLGLATVYGIVQQHQGWIEVASAPGQGSTFRVFFPSKEPSVLAEASAVPEARGGTEAILVVEDEPGMRDVTAMCLRYAGYKVEAAANGVEAIRLWEENQHKFDLLITDYVMPEGMTGVQLATQLRRANDQLRVIVMSGYIPGTRETAAPWPEAFTRLTKPFEARALLATVRRCLDEK